MIFEILGFFCIRKV